MKAGTATGLLAGQLMNCALISDSVKGLSLVRSVKSVLGLTQSTLLWLSGILSSKVKRPARDSDRCMLFRECVQLFLSSLKCVRGISFSCGATAGIWTRPLHC
jgi:hypothetical protein